MTSLIDTIEAAFRNAVEDADDGTIATTQVVEAIELYCKVSDDHLGTIEGIVDDAYGAAADCWGCDWRWQSGDVAERVCDGLRAFAIVPDRTTPSLPEGAP